MQSAQAATNDQILQKVDNLFSSIERLGTNVMIANSDFDLIYVNKKSKETLLQLADVIQSEFGVAVKDLVGGSIDRFHKGDSKMRIRQILSEKSNFPYRSKIKLADRMLDLNINSIEEESKIIGYVVNWEDITEKEAFDSEAAQLTSMMDAMPINVMCVDTNRVLNYLNPKAKETLKRLEHLLPVKAADLMGQSIDIFHKDPEYQKRILSDPKNLPVRTTIKLAEESLDLEVSPIYNRQQEYVGAMASWSVISDNVKVGSEVKSASQRLATASNNLLELSQSIAAGAEETHNQAQTVTQASDEASHSVESVAAAAEEMSKSIKEISDQVQAGAKKAMQAVKEAEQADTTMNSLSKASKEIGDVVKVIASIAQQTNLLALNATIEAARAGESGKGFAVVANEVKELALQTANATEEINQKIVSVQNEASGSVTVLKSISEAIEELREINTSVAAAVEEQNAATNEISRSASEASKSTQGVTSNIAHVTEAAQQSSDSANDLKTAAENMKELADQIENVNNFLKELGWA